jgi:hypothetical protein
MKIIVPALAATLFIALAAPAAAAVSDTAFSPDGAEARCGFVAEIGSYVCETKLPAGSLSEMSSAPQVGAQKLVPVPLGNPGVVQAGGMQKP